MIIFPSFLDKKVFAFFWALARETNQIRLNLHLLFSWLQYCFAC